MDVELAPEAFGYCWHRSNGEWYYGHHKGTFDDGYIGSGKVFMDMFKASDRSEWHRTIEFRGTKDECHDWEVGMVDARMIEQPGCLNMKTGGRAGIPCTETRRKMSRAHTGNVGEKNSFYGFTHTPEARAKMSASGLGRKLTEETKAKMSASRMSEGNGFYGKKHTPEAIEKMRAAKTGKNNARFGKKHTPETIAKMRESSKKKRDG